jgi:AraC family transcriptional activator of pobA
MKTQKPRIINSISQLHGLLSVPKTSHPLISLIRHNEENITIDESESIVFNFYNITLKRSFKGQMKYGKNYYDFDEGSMAFLSPMQVFTVDNNAERNKDGWSLLFHTDLIQNYSLAKAIKNYGFFSYDSNEALHLSSNEEAIIESLAKNIEQECQINIDNFNQDIIVSNLELLLNYCNRFYNRQFITRKMANNDLLTKFEAILTNYLEFHIHNGLPSVQNLAKELNVSTHYLSDMLRTVTGQNAQQHIHSKLIEKAKEKLATTNLSISEIAFELGFEQSQSFSKLFKSKVEMSPMEFRASFN